MTKTPTEAPIFQSSGKTFRLGLKFLRDYRDFELMDEFRTVRIEPDKEHLMKQSISMKLLNMDIYPLYHKASPKKLTIMFGLLEKLGALSRQHIMRKMLMLNIARA